MNDVDFPVAEVLEGIDAARRPPGSGPIKVNMVVKRGTNEHEILPMARHFRGTGIVLRFIEYMDVGATNGWRMDEVLPSAEVVERIARRVPAGAAGAQRARRDGPALGAMPTARGEIGVISSVTQAFCGDCNRARLSTEGQLYLCLFASRGHDLRPLLRGGASDEQIASAIGHIWQGRADRYSELRSTARARRRRAPSAAPRRNELHRRMSIRQTAGHHGPDPGRRPRLAHGRRRQGPAELQRHAAGAARAAAPGPAGRRDDDQRQPQPGGLRILRRAGVARRPGRLRRARWPAS